MKEGTYGAAFAMQHHCYNMHDGPARTYQPARPHVHNAGAGVHERSTSCALPMHRDACNAPCRAHTDAASMYS